MGQINYSYNLTGDCTNSSLGAFSLSYTASTPPLTITWTNPVSGITFSSQTLTENPYVITGLSGGAYTFYLTDLDSSVSSGGFYVTTSNTVSISSTTNTFCGGSNGALQVYTPNIYNRNILRLYDFSGQPINLGIDTTSTEPITAKTVTSVYSSFINLLPGLYYVMAEDLGGCMATSQTTLVKSSSNLDFGFYVIDSPFCSLGNGQIHLTGVTGTPPYTYKWSGNIDSSYNITTGNTNISITGLNSNTYLNLNVYSEVEKEKRDLQMEIGY